MLLFQTKVLGFSFYGKVSMKTAFYLKLEQFEHLAGFPAAQEKNAFTFF